MSALTPANRLVCQVALHTGLRLSDVLALKTDEISPRFWVVEQKTGKRKFVGLPSMLLERLKAQAGKIWVFEGRDSPKKHRSRQAVHTDVKRAAKAFRLRQNVAPHSFRKVYAVELLRKYHSIPRVQKALNHSNKSITLIYAMADELLAEGQGKRRTAVR